MKLYTLSYEQAQRAQDFIIPGVLDAPDAEKYWYLAAAEKGEGYLGLAVINPRTDRPELLSIAVEPSHRHEGIATELLDFALELLRKAGAATLHVIYSTDAGEWDMLDGWLSVNGFEQSEKEHNLYRITLAELGEQKRFHGKEGHSYSKAVSVAELSERSLRAFRGNMLRSELSSAEVIDKCDPEHSFVWMENDRVVAAFLLSPLEQGAVHNLWTWCSPKIPNPQILMTLFICAAQKATADYPPDTIVYFPCLGDSSERLVEYLMPTAQSIQTLRVYVCPTGTGDAQAEESEMEVLTETEAMKSYFEERQNDIQMEQVTNDKLCCADCAHRLDDAVTSCSKYLRKPGAVIHGGSCPMYSKDDAHPQ